MQNKLLETIISRRLHPLVIVLDESFTVKEWQGDPSWYGLSLQEGKDARDQLPFLIGLEDNRDLELPLLTLGDNKVVDITLARHENEIQLVIISSQHQHDAMQVLQQQGHSVSLLYEKLKKLSQTLDKKNQTLSQALETRNRFISGVSHEFRTPITSIIGHCELLSSFFYSEDEDQSGSFEAIEKNAKYLLALIDNLLEQGEISAERLTISPEPLHLRRFFRFLRDTFSVAAREKGLELEFRIDFEHDLIVMADEHHLYLLLVNLISNAVKFTDQGTVQVDPQWNDNRLQITIRDTGIGIPESDLEEILEAFSRASNVGSRRGSGLGLSIVKEVTGAMGGTIDISSEEGKGTAITVSIPAEEARAKQSVASGAAAYERQPVIMVVEDDTDISALYTIILKNANMRPECFSDTSSFIERLDQVDPDILLLDYHIGDGNGLDLARQARKHGFNRPIMLFTATSIINNELQKMARAAGCDRILLKPHDVTSLAEVLRSELART